MMNRNREVPKKNYSDMSPACNKSGSCFSQFWLTIWRTWNYMSAIKYNQPLCSSLAYFLNRLCWQRPLKEKVKRLGGVTWKHSCLTLQGVSRWKCHWKDNPAPLNLFGSALENVLLWKTWSSLTFSFDRHTQAFGSVCPDPQGKSLFCVWVF